jgi:hypothetical protein
MPRTRHLVVLGAMATIFALSAVPIFSADSGVVDASVTAAAPCITVSFSTLDFGTLPFSQGATPPASIPNPGSLTNCSVQQSNILLRGTDATGAGGVTWSLQNLAGCQQDAFASRLSFPGLSTPATTTDNAIFSMAAGLTFAVDAVSLTMPCTGSSGAGVEMSWQYIFTALLL